MQRFLLSLLFFVALATAYGQDTIRVQTLTWADDVRSGYFQFPDEPEQQFQKILMRYNMRCHNVAIGNGNTGCREWDYSCNTFITDPTRLDSARATHPSHEISGFDGTSFAFSDMPYYIYTQYEQTSTSFADTTSLEVVEVGTADFPLYVGANNGRSREQYLYTATELQAAGLSAGPITALQLQVMEAGGTLPFLRLRVKATNANELSATTPELTGFTEVYFQTTNFPATGWTSLPFYQSFDWDGTSNILLDISQTGTPAAPLLTIGGETTTGLLSAGALQAASPHYLGLQGTGGMEIPASALGMTEAVTVAFWSYGLPDAPTTNTTVFEAVDGANRRQMNVHLPWSDGNIYWDCGNDGSGYDRISRAAAAADLAGRWSHWAFTKDATTGEMSIYLDGVLWHSGTGNTKPIMASQMRVGSSANGARSYPGVLDNVSLWNRALSASEIQAMMYQEDISTDHPAITSLLAHYPLNEGSGLTANDAANGHHASLVGPNWQQYRGAELSFDWSAISSRAAARWEQGIYTLTNETIAVIDSAAAYPNTVVSYAVNGSNNLVITDTYETYAANETYLYDEAGNVLETYPLSADGSIEISTLVYHNKRPAKFEILSLVTPYGNGLDLGPEGKTFTFDLTDFTPILRGERFLSMEMGGQNQEEMDIEFLFITGTPPRDVLDIENVWPFARGSYVPIQADEVFEERELRLNPAADTYKVRASVTGHGQNGEFVSRQHYLNVDGGSQEFQFDVWKACGENPIYPQGGTWIFDRAGWCPGMATDVHEYFLPEDSGESVILDYGVNGAALTEANYLVATQLVSYGPPNFVLDAEVVDIIRPSTKVEYERNNPICDDPMIRVRNNGTETISSLTIDYGVEGSSTETYAWTGSIAPAQSVDITLPVDDYLFWETNAEEKVFQVSVTNPNEVAMDDYAPNNVASSAFEPSLVIDYEQPLFIQLKTNNRPNENRYTITDASGAVVLERSNMDAATTYRDAIDLPAGCYELTVEDDGGDGLDFWYWAAVGQNVGTGNVSLRRQLTESFYAPVRSFDPDFGGDLHFSFTIPQAVGTEDELTTARRFSVYPNPAQGQTTLAFDGYDAADLQWQLLDLTGKRWLQGQETLSGNSQQTAIDLSGIPAGIYVAKVLIDGKLYSQEVVVMPR